MCMINLQRKVSNSSIILFRTFVAEATEELATIICVVKVH